MADGIHLRLRRRCGARHCVGVRVGLQHRLRHRLGGPVYVILSQSVRSVQFSCLSHFFRLLQKKTAKIRYCFVLLTPNLVKWSVKGVCWDPGIQGESRAWDREGSIIFFRIERVKIEEDGSDPWKFEPAQRPQRQYLSQDLLRVSGPLETRLQPLEELRGRRVLQLQGILEAVLPERDLVAQVCVSQQGQGMQRRRLRLLLLHPGNDPTELQKVSSRPLPQGRDESDGGPLRRPKEAALQKVVQKEAENFRPRSEIEKKFKNTWSFQQKKTRKWFFYKFRTPPSPVDKTSSTIPQGTRRNANPDQSDPGRNRKAVQRSPKPNQVNWCCKDSQEIIAKTGSMLYSLGDLGDFQ